MKYGLMYQLFVKMTYIVRPSLFDIGPDNTRCSVGSWYS